MMVGDGDLNTCHRCPDENEIGDKDENLLSWRIRWLSEMGRFCGKTSVVLQILKKATASCNILRNIEPLLGMIEILLSSSIPQCFSASVLVTMSITSKLSAQ